MAEHDKAVRRVPGDLRKEMKAEVGVDSTVRGLGIGTLLLEPVLALADEAGRPCYLERAN